MKTRAAMAAAFDRSPGHPHEAARQAATDAVALLAALVLVLSLTRSLAGRFVLDIDVSNLALAIERFDLREHQPHPPGYLGYVLMLRLVQAVTRLPGLQVAQLTSTLFALFTIVFCFLAARRFYPTDRSVRRWAVLLSASHPLLLYYAVDGQTHSAEAAMLAALLWVLAAPPPLSWRRVVLVGVLLAAGGSFRVTYLLLSAPVIVWALWPDVRRMAAAALVGAAGTLAWLVPTVHLTGGLAAYRAASDALVGTFVRVRSPLSASSLPEAQAANAWETIVWSTVALLPALLALAVAPVIRPGEARPLKWMLLAVSIPSVLFYGLVLCAEPGYLAGLAPAACLLAAALSAKGQRQGRPAGRFGTALGRALPLGIAAIQIAFFFACPDKLGQAVVLPTIPEISRRELRTERLFEILHEDVGPEEHVLVVTDFPELSAARQFPLLRPHTEILFLHRAKWFPANGDSWISHASADGWRAAPGIVLRNSGQDSVLNSGTAYQSIVIDPLATEALRQDVARQSRCPIPSQPRTDDNRALRLPARCFPGRQISLSGRTFAFANPATPP